MAKTFQPGLPMKLLNGAMKLMLQRGFGPPGVELLTVRGRKSGQVYATPVSPVTREGVRYVVVAVRQRRLGAQRPATGEVSVGRGKQHAGVPRRPVEPAEAAPVLRQYVAENAITKPYFDATAASTDEVWALEAPRHPVFRLEAK